MVHVSPVRTPEHEEEELPNDMARAALSRSSDDGISDLKVLRREKRRSSGKTDCAEVIAKAVADCQKHKGADCQLEFDEGDYPLRGNGLQTAGLNSVSLLGDGAALIIKAVAMEQKQPEKQPVHKNLRANLGTDKIFKVARPTTKEGKGRLRSRRWLHDLSWPTHQQQQSLLKDVQP